MTHWNSNMDEAPHGSAYPPRCAEDIHAYDGKETVAGYSEYCPSDPFPGANRSPAYRWGWQNCHRDNGHEDDYDWLRYDYIRRFLPQPPIQGDEA